LSAVAEFLVFISNVLTLRCRVD